MCSAFVKALTVLNRAGAEASRARPRLFLLPPCGSDGRHTRRLPFVRRGTEWRCSEDAPFDGGAPLLARFASRDSVPVASANLELVRSLYGAWGRGDRSAIEWAHPQIEFVIADGPAPGSWTGRAGLAEGFRDLVSAWDEYLELDGERVLVLDHFSGRGRSSGLEVRQMRTEKAVLFHFRGSKVTRVVVYWDRERALADLGLAPQAGS